jgi:hypothetical protein
VAQGLKLSNIDLEKKFVLLFLGYKEHRKGNRREKNDQTTCVGRTAPVG